MSCNPAAQTSQAANAAQANPGTLPPSPCHCDSDPVEGLRQLFVDYAQGRALMAGRDPATRPVFLRLHGAAHARFIVRDDLPDALRVGVFAKAGEYAAWVRFSADVQPGNPDLKGTTGIGIKLFDVDGPKLLEPDTDAKTQDFILQNHDVFFVDTAKDMCEFTCQSLHGQRDAYLASHPVTAGILDEMKKVVESVLTTPYWSCLPSRFGQTRHVKYKIEPVDAAQPDTSPDFADPFYLRADLHQRLRNGPARLRFMVQFQTDPDSMPPDAATVRWSETASEPIEVAVLELPQQDLDTRGQSTYGENLAFNTWHSLEAHSPVGSIAEARKVVYRASAFNRRNVNGVPLGEPAQARPPQYAPSVDYPAAKDSNIVRAAIHPAIGIARVGNSAAQYYVGPQLIEPPAMPESFYRDSTGALKREAAQFRVYGYNAAGEVVRELTGGWADVKWQVHLANRKAAWYRWQQAMDIPESADLAVPLRNKDVTARETLVIDAGMQHVAGANAAPVVCAGEFCGVPVKIGELLTDGEGRLVVLGGHGISASPTHAPIYDPKDKQSFINADGWYDDTCDGTVGATVTIEGRPVPVEPAWVVTAPPDYAPGVKGVRTLYDLLYDVYAQAGWLSEPAMVSFASDVQPVLQRLTDLQWVNQGFATQFGFEGRFDFSDAALLKRLSQLPAPGGYDVNAELRRQIFNSFRPPEGADGNQMPWPWIYGDAMTVPAGESPRQNASVSATQYTRLKRWAEGDFIDDWQAQRKTYAGIDDVPLADQPATLDRAALDFCLADAFHPGCEMTWPMRHLSLYYKPFRIRARAPGVPETNYGPTLDQARALGIDGPLHAQGPGDINRWMGLPWQADTAYCRAGYDTEYDPFAPTFWPARVPNHVLSASDYAIVTDPRQSPAKRREAFANRTNWNKPLHGDTATQMQQMVRIFGSMGHLTPQPGVPGDTEFPASMRVATYGPDVPLADASSEAPAQLPAEAEAVTVAATPGLKAAAQGRGRVLPRGANFRSVEEAESAPRPVRSLRKP